MPDENPYLPDGSLRLSATVAPLVSPLPVIVTPATIPTLLPDVLRRAIVNQFSAGTEVLAEAEPGKRHQILGWTLTFANLGGEEDHTITFYSNDTPITGSFIVPSATGAVPLISAPLSLVPIVETAVGEALKLTTANMQVRGIVVFITEDASNPR